MIAAEGRAQLPIHRLELRRDQHAAHRESIGDAFGYGDDVRADVEPLVGEELSASSVAALNLVADEDRAIFLAGSGQPLGKLFRGQFDATHTLDAL